MARSFNGSTDFAEATSPISAYPFTFACWAYPTSVSSVVTLMSTGANFSGSGGFDRLFLFGSDAHEIAAQTLASGNGIAKASVGASANTWCHATGVFAATNSRSAFFNGGSSGTDTTSIGGPTKTLLDIGRNLGNNLGEFFPGRIALPAVWNVALNASEVAALATGVMPYLVRPNALVSFSPFDGLTSPEPDFTGNARNFMLTGTSLANGPPVTLFTPRWPINSEIASSPPAGGGHILPFPWEQMSGGMQTMTGGMRG